MNQTKRAALMFTALIIVYTLFDYFVLRNPVDTPAPAAPLAQTQPEKGSAKP